MSKIYNVIIITEINHNNLTNNIFYILLFFNKEHYGENHNWCNCWLKKAIY